MNKRQRRKHRLGEFRELGFELRFSTPGSWSEEGQDVFREECIDQVEALGLAVGGGTGIHWGVFVTALRDRGTVTAEQRQALLRWLAGRPELSELHAGVLEDAWHPAESSPAA